jgi:hypothetical protein
MNMRGVFCVGVLATSSIWGCVGDSGNPNDAGPDVDLTGTEGHSCFANKTCDANLTCISTVCVRLDAGSDGATDASTDASTDADASPPPCNYGQPFGTPTLITNISTTSNENVARVTADELTAYFDSDKPGGSGLLDMYVATRAKRTDPFLNIVAVPGLNTSSSDSHMTIASDQLTIFYESTQSGVHILSATRGATNQNFTGAAFVTGIQTGSKLEGTPFLRADGLELWFTSDRADAGTGNHDLWRASGSGVSFTSPTPLTELNSSVDDAFPALTADGLTVFWSTTRTDGTPTPKGANDIWTAHRTNLASPFTGLTNVAELNSNADDWVGSTSPDGCRIYFGSNRSGGAGGYDIYVAERP